MNDLTEADIDILEQLYATDGKGLPLETAGALIYGAPVMVWMTLVAKGYVAGYRNHLKLTPLGKGVCMRLLEMVA